MAWYNLDPLAASAYLKIYEITIQINFHEEEKQKLLLRASEHHAYLFFFRIHFRYWIEILT